MELRHLSTFRVVAANGMAAVLCVTYLFAAIHKTNENFLAFDAARSSAVDGLTTFWIYGDLGEEPPVWAMAVAIYGTIALEALAPIVAWRVRRLRVPVILALFATSPSGQAQPPSQTPPSAVGLVKKNRAPVSNDTLKVKLPKPQEVDLPSGLHLMVLEDHRLPRGHRLRPWLRRSRRRLPHAVPRVDERVGHGSGVGRAVVLHGRRGGRRQLFARRQADVQPARQLYLPVTFGGRHVPLCPLLRARRCVRRAPRSRVPPARQHG